MSALIVYEPAVPIQYSRTDCPHSPQGGEARAALGQHPMDSSTRKGLPGLSRIQHPADGFQEMVGGKRLSDEGLTFPQANFLACDIRAVSANINDLELRFFRLQPPGQFPAT